MLCGIKLPCTGKFHYSNLISNGLSATVQSLIYFNQLFWAMTFFYISSNASLFSPNFSFHVTWFILHVLQFNLFANFNQNFNQLKRKEVKVGFNYISKQISWYKNQEEKNAYYQWNEKSEVWESICIAIFWRWYAVSCILPFHSKSLLQNIIIRYRNAPKRG